MSKNIKAKTVGELIKKLSTLDRGLPIEYEYYAIIFNDDEIRIIENSWGIPEEEL